MLQPGDKSPKWPLKNTWRHYFPIFCGNVFLSVCDIWEHYIGFLRSQFFGQSWRGVSMVHVVVGFFMNLPFGVLCHIGTISATCARYFRWLYEHANSKTSVSSLYFHKKSLICFNQIHQKITLFFEILQSNSTVTSLDLTDTNLGADGARHIADLLRENHFITELVGTSVVTTLTFPRGICRFTNKNEAIQQFCPKISKQNTDTLHIRQINIKIWNIL